MIEKRFTREEVNKIIYEVRTNFYRLFGDEMTLSERLLFNEICTTFEEHVDYKMDKLEKGEEK